MYKELEIEIEIALQNAEARRRSRRFRRDSRFINEFPFHHPEPPVFKIFVFD